MSHRVRASVLLADRNDEFRKFLAGALEDAGFAAAQCASMADAESRLEGFAYDALVVDVRLTDGDGLDVLDSALARYPTMRCVVTADFGSLHHAVRALKRGAQDFLVKPCDVATIIDAITPPGTGRHLSGSSGEPHHPSRSGGIRTHRIVGESPAIKRLLSTLQLVAPMQSTVLIKGETGTGKELVARTIHANSPRRDQPFVAFNAAAVPEGLAEAELFGHVKGAFTGAIQSRAGRFEAADRGTLFIDEVSSMPMSLQSKLLRALQEREVERVGTCQPVKINTRVIAATNVDLRAMVKAGTFREDLFYRLNVIGVDLPPLRVRKSDIPLLARHFVRQSCEINERPEKTLGQSALRALMAADWPGNIRQLQNAIEHAVAMSGDSGEILEDALPEDIRHGDIAAAEMASPVLALPAMPDEGIDFASTMSRMERELILNYLQKTGGNRRQAARLLRLSRTTLIDKLQRLGVADAPAGPTAVESAA